MLSRIGLPLSQLSACASTARLSCMRLAMATRMLARSAALVRPHASFAAWAASSACSMSAVAERAISHSGLPFTGEVFSNVRPLAASIHSPPMKLP